MSETEAQNRTARRMYADSGKPYGDSEAGFTRWAAEHAKEIADERETIRQGRRAAIDSLKPRLAEPR